MGLEFSVNCCRDVDWFVSRKQQQQTNTDLNTEEHLNVIMLRISSAQKILITIFFLCVIITTTTKMHLTKSPHGHAMSNVSIFCS